MNTDTTSENALNGLDDTPRGSSRALCGAAVVAFLIGIALTFYAIRLETGMSPTLQRKTHDLERLDAMRAELKRGFDAVAAFESAGAAQKPVPLADLMRDTLQGFKPDEIKDIRRDSVQGWIIREKEIVFNEAPLGPIMAFLNKAEDTNPPWRLSKCSIRISPRTAAVGRIELTLDAVEKIP